jgi:hypothetical protein
MNEAIFNTLAAVALMCGQHIQPGKGSMDLDFIPNPGSQYQAGFEDCRIIVARLRAETEKRVKEAQAKQLAEDAARVRNALAAVQGGPFKPEPAPLERSALPQSTCIFPAGALNTNNVAP